MAVADIISILANVTLDNALAAATFIALVVLALLIPTLVLERRFISRSSKQRRDIIALIQAVRRGVDR